MKMRAALALALLLLAGSLASCGGRSVSDPDDIDAGDAGADVGELPMAASCYQATRICTDADAGMAWRCFPTDLDRCTTVRGEAAQTLCCL